MTDPITANLFLDEAVRAEDRARSCLAKGQTDTAERLLRNARYYLNQAETLERMGK